MAYLAHNHPLEGSSRASRRRPSTTRATSRFPRRPTSPSSRSDPRDRQGQARALRRGATTSGDVINPMIVDGMVHGGIAQGVGSGALRVRGVRHERPAPERQHDGLRAAQGGRHLVSYETGPDRMTPSPVNPMGIKGAGETGTIASTAAVANAVMDALAPLGISHLDMPLTPARIWAAIQVSRPRLHTVRPPTRDGCMEIRPDPEGTPCTLRASSTTGRRAGGRRAS